MARVAIASSSSLAADAGARVADEGGNAVDAAVAAALVSLTTEPGVVSPGGGGFVTVWPGDGPPITVDGNVEVPGRGLTPDRLARNLIDVELSYGGGVHTQVGYGSVATPGAMAALALAAERYGKTPWRILVEPAYELARDGFPLSQPSHDYLKHSHESVFGWHPASHEALHDETGELLPRGTLIQVADLAQSLAQIARYGARDMYRGDLARLIADDSEANGGVLTLEDLAAYRAQLRAPLDMQLGEWRFATNPPPAIGGIVLTGMLMLMRQRSFARWTADDVAYLVRVQQYVLGQRRDVLDLSENIGRDGERLLERCRSSELASRLCSPSTVHTSTADDGGLGCAITLSAGYGSGVIPRGTGIWMNNCLGELELNRRGPDPGPPGTRLPSNMAPSVARRADGGVLAIGSPGADRITSALLQALVNYTQLGMSLQDAVRHPRVHVELSAGRERLACEPGIPVDKVDVQTRPFESLSMFFGGVAATVWSPGSDFEIAADPRRTGGEALGGEKAATPAQE